MNARRRESAFTLIELLVVIAIIGLLAGLLAPALLQGRDAALTAHCLGSMRQVATATLMYADQHNDTFPRSQHSAFARRETAWAKAIAPFLNVDGAAWSTLLASVYHCPADARRGRPSYGLNVYFELGPDDSYEGAPTTWRRVTDVPNPSATILFAENNSDADHIMPHFWTSPADAADCAHDRHAGRANYAFVDGHVETRALTETFDPARDVDAWHP